MSAPYFTPDQDWLSECCGALSEGELFTWFSGTWQEAWTLKACGRCSKCHQNTNFTKDETKPTTKGK